MRIRVLFTVILMAMLGLTACGGGSDTPKAGETTKGSTPDAGAGGYCEGATDLLKEVCDKGKITVSTDPAYPPQSSLNQQTGEYEGFDIDVATEIAKRLGVDVAWEAPSWDVITAGGWNGRWDMTVGSMTPTNDRQKVLDFTQPYYYTPAVVVVGNDSKVTDVATDLDGKKVGVCSACTYDMFLQKKLDIKGFTFDFVIDNADIAGYDTDTTALDDLTNGRLDGVITSMTTAQGYIDAGNPVKIVGDPVFYEPLSAGFDKSATPSDKTLFEAVDKIVGEMHDDGTLSELSKKWYDGLDLSVEN